MCSGKIKEVSERVFHRREQHVQRSNAKKNIILLRKFKGAVGVLLYSSLNLLTPYYGYSESPIHVGSPLCSGLGSELFCFILLLHKNSLHCSHLLGRHQHLCVLLAIDLQDIAHAAGEKPYRKRGQCLMKQTFNGSISGNGSNPLF